jgi:hypothetical protein
MRVKISEEQRDLKKEQADRPDGRGPAKPGKNDFCNDWFDLKEEEGAEENRCAEDPFPTKVR